MQLKSFRNDDLTLNQVTFFKEKVMSLRKQQFQPHTWIFYKQKMPILDAESVRGS